ncbi:MAG: beta-lactamase family protein [Acidobacteria bacterium]|nr:beta-lactamase family protein [Acidobacteriota bacterium]
MAHIEGFVAAKYEGVAAALSKSLDQGGDIGASVCVIHGSEMMVDIWGGFADEAKTVPWDRDTLVNVWSTTKTMTFLVALMLSDRGLLNFHAPVARYWPQFAASDKASIEVRHIMGHTAGLSGWSVPIVAQDLADWEFCTSALAEQAPWWPPGSASGYHALTQGYLIGELVRRITGTSIGQFFKTEVADVLNADFHIGLPESEESRVSLVVPPPPLDLAHVPRDSVTYRTFSSPMLDATMPHHRWWRAAEIPAANGHGNARSVAMVQQIIANKGEAHGHRFFSEQTADLIFESQAHGVDLALGDVVHFGMGYGLASSKTPLGPRTCYWGGYGGSVIIMDQEQQLTIAYMMNKMGGSLSSDERGVTIALQAAISAMS